MPYLAYKSVMTLGGSNRIVCRSFFDDPFDLLGDALAKVWCPIPRYLSGLRSRWDARYDLRRDPSPLLEHPAFIQCGLTAFDRERPKLLYRVRLRTAAEPDSFHRGAQSGSDSFYRLPEYSRLAGRYADLLRAWTDGDIGVAQALASLAARDLHHELWGEAIRARKLRPETYSCESSINP